MRKYIILLLIMIFPSLCLGEKIIIGEKSFLEQYLLGGIVAEHLKNAGFEVEEKPGILTTSLRSELVQGKVHMYWEYTGTAARALIDMSDRATFQNPELLYQAVKKADRKNGIIWLNRTEINNGWVLAAKKATSEYTPKYIPETIEELATIINKGQAVTIVMLSTFYNRKGDGFKFLENHYGFNVPLKNLVLVGEGESLGILKRGKADFAIGYGTDPEIENFGLYIVQDNQRFWPAYNPVLTIREEILSRYPQISALVNSLVPHLDQEAIIRMNYRVKFGKEPIKKVISEFLIRKGLL